MALDSMLAYVAGVGGGGDKADKPAPKELGDNVYILGHRYSHKNDGKEIGKAVTSMAWFTYRRGFPAIGRSPFTSDAGWGCMLRCGQMVVAEAMLRCRGGPLTSEPSRAARAEVRRAVLANFADVPPAVFSIHSIAIGGLKKMKRPVGEWFGPNCLAQVLREISRDVTAAATARGGAVHGVHSVPLATHVAMDSVLSIDEVLSTVSEGATAVSPPVDAAGPGPEAAAAAGAGAGAGAAATGSPEGWHPLLLLIPLRLGLEAMGERYFVPLQRMFTLPQCVGAAGGRPNAAFYFAGCRDELLLYLDPHMPTQPTVGAFNRDTSISSYTPSGLQSLHMSEADPSILLGFVCPTRASFDDFLERVAQLKTLHPDEPPLFSVVEKGMAAALGGGAADDDFSFGDDDDDGFEVINVP
mmetsp:Transcript_28195/g.73915  ORF Transcript_28195/g.73915 Transcript_28195/m.73915 type:complete len:412 (+) Transcript_28195:313-1548(+)